MTLRIVWPRGIPIICVGERGHHCFIWWRDTHYTPEPLYMNHWWFISGDVIKNDVNRVVTAFGCSYSITCAWGCFHDDVIQWTHFPRYWPFVRGIHWSPVNSQHKVKWYGALMFSLICAWLNGWVNNGEVGNLGRHRVDYDVTVMLH